MCATWTSTIHLLLLRALQLARIMLDASYHDVLAGVCGRQGPELLLRPAVAKVFVGVV